MVCSNCGYALGPEDQYCGGCGAYLTEAPAEEPTPGSTTGPDHWAAGYQPAEHQVRPPRRSGTIGVVIGALAVLVITAVLFIWLGNRDGEDDQSASPTSTTPAPTATESPSQPPTTAAPTTPTTAPTTPTAEPTRIELPGSATQCNNVGGMAVFRGNDQTSCQFAENVARAFGALEQPVTAAVTLADVASPITGRTYDLACDFSSPVRCTGGDNAVIYLSPSA